MGYQPQLVDVPFYGPNQALPDRAGPSGRIKLLKNAKVRKYVASAPNAAGTVTPSRIQIDPRDGLVPLASSARSVTDGGTVSVDWATPQLLAPIGPQLVDISGGILRVWNGTSWTAYSQNRVVAHPLSQSVLHTSQKLIQAPDQAWIGGVTCAVWTETTATSSGAVTSSWVGFKADNGAWLVVPAQLYAASVIPDVAQAKVVHDGAVFWVLYNTSTNVNINVYDTHGALLGSSSTAIALPAHAAHAPGYWDVTACPSTGGYTVLVAIDVDATSLGLGLKTYALKWTGSAIATNSTTISTISGGSLAFLTNDTGNGAAYLTVTVGGTPEAINAYEITNQAISHTYVTGVTVASDNVDTVTGFVNDATSRSVVISYGLFSGTASVGPRFDPQRRQIKSFFTTTSNVTLPIRTTQSLTQVSRAFAIDGVYHTVGYYQSGSGVVLTPRSTTVNPTVGDSMTGAATQALAVTAGDLVVGSPITITGAAGATQNPNITATSGTSAVSVTNTDWVALSYSSGRAGLGVPDGTPLWQWRFSNLSPIQSYIGSRLTISGSVGVTGANTTWDVVDIDSIRQTFYTRAFDVNNAVPMNTGGSFSAAGTVQAVAMIGYQVQALNGTINDGTVSAFIGGTVTVTGSAFSNGTFTVARIYYGNGPNFNVPPSTGWTVIWVVKTTQTGENHAFSGTLTPVGVNQWTFAAGDFDSSYIGAQLVISNDAAQPGNNNTYTIVSVQGPTTFTTSGPVALPQVFDASGATAEIQLTTSAYLFAIGALPADYTFMGALVNVQGAVNPANDGTYTVVQVNADGSFVATPNDGLADQVNEALGPAQTVTIYFPQNQPTLQPTWYLVPISSEQPITGRFEYGSAYADWRTEGDQILGGNIFNMALTTPQVTPGGVRLLLPYRAQNVVEAEPLVAVPGQQPVTVDITESTIGLKVFTLGIDYGQPIVDTTTMLLPGPMAQAFSQSGVLEAGIGLAPEAPFLVSQSVGATGVIGLVKGATYIYQPVFEVADENGDLISSIPCLSPLTVQMVGNNNVATIGGRLAFPLDATGAPVANTYGPLTRNVTLAIYRTAMVGGVSTTEKFKITNGLSPNELAPMSAANPSGFSFPDTFTWNYVDATPDAGLTASQAIYSDTEFPHYPAPAFSRGFGNYKNRDWALAYDGSLWASAEKQPGQAVWWHPAFRWTFPQSDPPKTVAYLEDSVFVFCSRSIYEIPLGGAQLPTATGGGGLPTPVLLPFPNGSVNGYALSIPGMVVYDSTAGGVWAITRARENVWLSHAMVDSLTGAVAGLAVDGDQKLYILQQGSSDVLVYDHLPGIWGIVTTPTAPKLIASFQGAFAYQDTAAVYLSTPGATADIVAGVPTAIAPDVTFASISFASVRGQKMVWALQLVGTYLGPHRINFVVSYPDDGYADQVIAPFTPSAANPYIIPFYLMNEEVTSFGLRIYADFTGVATPGASFALELISAEIGIERGGLAKLPDSRSAV